jgi:large subunit ribosomal protein L18
VIKEKTRLEGRKIRQKRTRKKVFGTKERPRLSVFRSLNHIYAQIIDDTEGRTLVSASSLDPEIRNSLSGNKKEKSKVVGSLIAKRALEKGIDKVVFDRAGYKYHGRVALLAEAAREAGLKF